MTNLFRRINRPRWGLQWLLVLGVVLAGFGVLAQTTGRSFDHFSTGFALTGVHSSTRCESCHVGGVFKGTPRSCSNCHVSGSSQSVGNTVKPANHFVTQQTCDTCHTTSTFVGARFDHVGVGPAACASCHNNIVQKGKPFGHIVTDVTCSQCHTTRGWLPATSADHKTFTPATVCVTCHNGTSATGKTAAHIPTANNCSSCHSYDPQAWTPTTWNHTQMPVANQCSACHSGAFTHVVGPNFNHIPYKSLAASAAANCDTCHKSGYSSFAPGLFHANITVTGQCATCHLGTGFGVTGKPSNATHATVTGDCENCHTTASWSGGKPNHALFTPATQCATCHNGNTAAGRNSTHIPTSANCVSCHSATQAGWKPTLWNHTQVAVANQCSTCHSGAFFPANGKTPDHIPTTGLPVPVANCDTCHKGGFGSWNPGLFHSNVTVTTQCATCHLTGSFGLTSKPSNSIHAAVTGNCESCHNPGGWIAKPDHSGFNASTNCATCHNGAPVIGKPAKHIATTQNCVSCHSATQAAWRPASWNHTQQSVTNCASCHNGSSATGQPATHMPTGTMQCSSCHSGFAAWKPTTWNHTQMPVANQCSTCHSGNYLPADGKPATHISYSAIPAATNCDSCHKGGFASWNPGRVHANLGINSMCSTCHLTASPGVTGKPSTPVHTGVVSGCETCHNSTTSWGGARPDHAGFTQATVCTTCHNGSAAKGKNSSHFPTTLNCISCHSATQPGWKPASWNHTQMPVAGQCATCHTGAYVPADGKTANHVPYQSLTGVTVGNCDTCHKGGFASWNPGRFHANVKVTNQCATCHLTAAFGVTPKSSTPIHATVTGNCESCHNTGSWFGAKPDHATFTVATTCTTCHNGVAASGKKAGHFPTTMNCAACHNPNQTGWKPTSWNHTQMPVASQCATCHTGAYPPADGKTANHIPYQTVNAAVAANCDTCHKGGYASWNPGRFHSNVSVTSQCATCHLTAAYGVTPKSSTPIHATVTGNCESCHTNTSSWFGAKPDHAGYNASTNCASCHNGSAGTGKNNTHIPTTLNCASCHSATQPTWKPANWNHTQMPVANQCATCHTGAFFPADGKTANHVPYQSLSGVAIGNCDTCHKGGFASWNPGLFHSNVSVSNQCATCHLTGAYGVTAKPANAVHAAVSGNCENCHKTTGWTGSIPNHSAFNAATNCASCHNGAPVIGKPASHIATTLNCISCHSATQTTWRPSGWNHTQQPVTNCSSCHNGVNATGKAAVHIPTGTMQCSSCHTGYTAWKPTVWNHTQTTVVNTCSTCHTGAFPPADGKTVNHIPYQSVSGVAIANCDTCHKGGFTLWNPGRFHANVSVSTQCATCHLTTAYGVTGKPGTAIHASVTGNCENCHKTTAAWVGGKPDHGLFNAATVCSSCHNGAAASGKPATHIPTTLNCISCHTATATWKPASWNHTQMPVANQCASCHTGAFPPADGKVANHIPYQSVAGVAIANCDTCHKGGFASWNPGRFHANVSVSTQCATCHLTTAYGVTGKPSTAIHATVTGNCESCHKTTSSWFGGKPDHALFNVATVCSTCHNGGAASGKPATHIPTTLNCISCHTPTATWRPAQWNHTQMPVANQCASCHTGAFPPADGKVANHIPYQSVSGVAIANCDTCHKSGFASWNPGRFHANVSVTTQCATCHLTTAYAVTGKPANATHATVTGSCESCHKSPASWLTVTYTHSPANAVGTHTCASCHTGAGAKGLSATHVPVPGVACDFCHASQTSFATAITMSHTAVAAQSCKSCHNGAYLSEGTKAGGALGKPANHIPEAQLLNGAAMDCKTCHTTTSYTSAANWATLASKTVLHNGSQGNGSGWCKSCHSTGTAYLGNMERMSLNHRGGTSVKTDCSQSGCHRPIGSFGVSWSKWN